MKVDEPVSASIVTTPSLVGFADFAHRGYRQAIAIYRCTVGNVALPGILVLIGDRGRLLGSLNLGGIGAARSQAEVKSMTLDGDTEVVRWDTFDGAGASLVHESARVSYTDGRLQATDVVSDYSPRIVTDEILGALARGRRSWLLDPDVITAKQWKTLAGGGSDWTTQGCEVRDGVAHCTITLTDTPIIMTVVTLAKAPGTVYGWKVTAVPVPFES